MELIVIWIVSAILASIIMGSKGRSSCGGLLMVVLLGPIGVIVALCIPSVDNDTRDTQRVNSGELRKCPFCAEAVKREAKVCRYCGRDLP